MNELEFVMSVIALIENNWVISKAQEKPGWKHPRLSRRLKDPKFLKMVDDPRIKKVLEKKAYSLKGIGKGYVLRYENGFGSYGDTLGSPHFGGFKLA